MKNGSFFIFTNKNSQICYYTMFALNWHILEAFVYTCIYRNTYVLFTHYINQTIVLFLIFKKLNKARFTKLQLWYVNVKIPFIRLFKT